MEMEGGAARHTPPSRVEEPQDEHPVALLPAPPGYHNQETYIVQIPKDQVYRVPPPENAYIVEKYRNPREGKRKKKNFSCIFCFCKVAIILLAILVLLAITLAILFFVFKPKPPAFSVTNLVVKNPAAGKNSRPRPQYQISLTTKNPNPKYGLQYDKDAPVSLLFNNKKVGAAKFPFLQQQPSASSKVRVEVAGSNEALPAQMEKSMDSNKSNIPISLDLEMNLRVRIRTPSWLSSWIFKSHVACKFKVTTLRNHTRVSSQQCKSNFGR